VIELRPYQQDCIRRIREALAGNSQPDRKRRVMLASPTASGKTVMFAGLAMAIAAHGNRILILAHRQKITEQISETLNAFNVPHGSSPRDHRRIEPVQVAMVMTLANRLDQYAGGFHLVVTDEAHHSVAPTWSRILVAFPHAYVLGVSATPERLDGKPLRDLYDELVIGPSVAQLARLGFLSLAVTFAAPISPDLSGIRTRLGDFDQTALAERRPTAS
jgi:superfamily II DNA or RNA helicase